MPSDTRRTVAIFSNLPARLRERFGLAVFHVLEVQSHGAGINQRGGGFGDVMITAFEIRRHRHAHASGDALHDGEHLALRDAFFIGIAEREGDARAGGGNRRKAGFFENARAGAIPRVRQDQNFRPVMQPPQQFRFFVLGAHGFHYRQAAGRRKARSVAQKKGNHRDCPNRRVEPGSRHPENITSWPSRRARGTCAYVARTFQRHILEAPALRPKWRDSIRCRSESHPFR